MLVRYFETLKETMNLYVERKEKGLSAMDLINSNYFLELYLIQYRFISDSFRSFVTTLTASTNTEYQTTIDSRMAAFIVFVILIIIAYLILWTPFVSKLNKEVTIFLFIRGDVCVDMED